MNSLYLIQLINNIYKFPNLHFSLYVHKSSLIHKKLLKIQKNFLLPLKILLTLIHFFLNFR